MVYANSASNADFNSLINPITLFTNSGFALVPNYAKTATRGL